jgi:small-conductance mechanosensitive channel
MEGPAMPILERIHAIRIYDNSLLLCAGAVLGALVVYLCLMLLRRIVINYAMRQRTRYVAYQFTEAIAQNTYRFAVAALALIVFEHVLTLPASVESALSAGITIAVVLQLGLWATAVCEQWISHYILRRTAENPQGASAANIIKFLFLVTVWAMLVLLTLSSFGVNISGLIAGLGIGGVAIAFALQSVLKDLFASLAIVLDKPFVVGDFIIFGDQLGSVERIGLKTTRIRSLWGEQIAVSNDDLLNTRVRNYKRMDERRVSFNIMVTFETPLENLEKIPGFIRDFIGSIEACRFDRSHVASFENYGPRIETVYYVLSPDYNIYMDIQQRINFAIAQYFSDNAIQFAYPTRRLLAMDPKTAQELSSCEA